MTLEPIVTLYKRVSHFVGERPMAAGPHGLPVPAPAEPKPACKGSLRPLVENFDLMLEPGDSLTDHLFWQSALAASLNRWIDSNPVKGNPEAEAVLRWWRDTLFFRPSPGLLQVAS